MPSTDHVRDNFRRILQVGIHNDNTLTPGGSEARGYRRLVAKIPREHYDPRLKRIPVKGAKNLYAVIRRTVVDIEDLEFVTVIAFKDPRQP
jgi:hypothetical protein